MMVGDNLCRDIAGALRCGYNWGALLKRPGSLFALNSESFSQHYPDKAQRTLRLENLNELAYALST